MLIQASILLNFNKLDRDVEISLEKAKQIFTQENNQLAVGETIYLEVIREIKKIVDKQKQMVPNKKKRKLEKGFTMDEKANDEFNFHEIN